MQNAEEFTEAYLAGWKDAKAERDYDPGAAMPDRVVSESPNLRSVDGTDL